MSTSNSCSFHPTKPALYRCPKCQAYFCPDCISRRNVSTYGKQKVFSFCPKCNIPADALSVGSFITPFWRRLPSFFVYPLHLRPLVLILLLSSASVFLSWVPFMHILLWAILIKYSYAVLRNTSQGDLSPPALLYEVIGENLGQAFKQIGLFLIVGVALAMIFAKFGPIMGLLSLMFAVLLMPAMIIVLAISNRLLGAVNPVVFVTLAYRIGWGYLLMYLFLALLLGAPAALVAYFPPSLPPKVAQFLISFANDYYTIVSYSLMGYVILQYHEDIGYEVDAESFTDQAPVLGLGTSSAEKEKDAIEALLNQVSVLVKDGRVEEAVMLMRDRMKGRPADCALCERYYNLLKITQRTSDMLAHGITYLDLLTTENEKASACEVYRECLAISPQFTPQPDALFKVSSWCTENGDTKNGLNGFIKFIKANPEHPLAPKAQFLLGKNLHEKIGNSGKAEQVLKGLIHRYPHHDITLHAQKYLEAMRKTAVAGG